MVARHLKKLSVKIKMMLLKTLMMMPWMRIVYTSTLMKIQITVVMQLMFQDQMSVLGPMLISVRSLMKGSYRKTRIISAAGV